MMGTKKKGGIFFSLNSVDIIKSMILFQVGRHTLVRIVFCELLPPVMFPFLKVGIEIKCFKFFYMIYR